jgi:hypothetical protein
MPELNSTLELSRKLDNKEEIVLVYASNPTWGQQVEMVRTSLMRSIATSELRYLLYSISGMS